MTLAVLMMATLSACARSNSAAVVARQLPPPPTWAAAVTVPDPKAGDDALAVAVRERGGRVQANRIIRQFEGWYQQLRTEYAKEMR